MSESIEITITPKGAWFEIISNTSSKTHSLTPEAARAIIRLLPRTNREGGGVAERSFERSMLEATGGDLEKRTPKADRMP